MGGKTSIFEICKGTNAKEKLISSIKSEKIEISQSLGELHDKIVEPSGYSYFSETDRKVLSMKYLDKELTEIMNPSKWQTSEIIGQGSFGRVLFAANSDTGELMAMKQIPIVGFSFLSGQERIKELETEVEILSKLSHQNIVRYLGTRKDEDYLMIFMEYVAGGTISTLLQKYGAFNESLIRVYAQHILEGLEYLHYNNIIHRDIKGANVLVGNDGVCKLADFGSSKRIISYEEMPTYKSLKGTTNWMAPEVMRQDGHGRFADIWSFGCLLVEMATGKPPWYYKTNQIAVFMHVCNTQQVPELPSSLSLMASDFILSCFKRKPCDRPNASKLLNHPFIKGINTGSSSVPPSIKVEENFNSSNTKYSSYDDEELKKRTNLNLNKEEIRVSIEVHKTSFEDMEGLNPEQALKSPFNGILTVNKFKTLSCLTGEKKKIDEDICLFRPSNFNSFS